MASAGTASLGSSSPNDEVSQLRTPYLDDNANANPFFSSPEIRAFLFGTSDSLLSDFPNTTAGNKKSSAKANHELHRRRHNALIIDSNQSHELDAILSSGAPKLMEPVINYSAAKMLPVGDVAPLASGDDDADLSSGVSCVELV